MAQQFTPEEVDTITKGMESAGLSVAKAELDRLGLDYDSLSHRERALIGVGILAGVVGAFSDPVTVSEVLAPDAA